VKSVKMGAVLLAMLASGPMLGAQTASTPASSAPAAPMADHLRGIKSKSELDALVAKLRAGELKGPQSLFEKERGTYRVYTSHIDKRKGMADIHPDDDEIFLVLSGSARCTLGGDIAEKKLVGTDYHGTQIVGGTTTTVSAGDIVSAPRGTAHQMDPGTGHVLYVVIKIIGKP
jgi:mannose-6-phosphate isomerase-like protein (cupin superfamily)